MASSRLECWLKENNFGSLLAVLENNGISTLEDLQMLENENDANELCQELGLKIVQRKKFKKILLELINSGHSHSHSPMQKVKEPGIELEIDEEKKEDDRNNQLYGNSQLRGYIQVPQRKHLSIDKKHRTMMVIGATGTGKTILLNSMMNYLWNVKYSDLYRYKLVYEQQKVNGQAVSMTDFVTAYHLEPPALDYQLTVIDTPGYGDTRGIEQDKKITANIKKFFEHKIQEIDAICFVIRAPQARLTPTQKYIFSQVLGIFGNDIAENIFILLTFADGKKPPALAALKAGKVPYKKYFKLNNSAFELDNVEGHISDHENDEETDDFAELFWNMGMKSFAKLFNELNKVKTKSLTLTKKVLTRREELENYIEGIQPTINAGFTILENIRQQIIIINKYSDLIDANKNFMVETTLSKARQIPNGGTCTTTCIQCNYTCHKSCGIPDDSRKDGCCAMRNGNCVVCPNKCHWMKHRNLPYTVEWYTVKEKKPVKELKDKYYDAKNKQSVSDQLIAGLTGDLAKVEKDLHGLINNVRECINELSTIALLPNVLSQDDYLDKLIQSEETGRKPGWQQRCHALKQLKKKQEMLCNINSKKYNPWKQYNDVKKYIKSKQQKNKSKKQNSGWFSGWW